MTEWRCLDWLPDYEVSEDGLVRRTTDTANPRYKSGYVIKGYMAGSRRSYRYYKLMMPEGGQLKIAAHRLVCEAWHGKAPPEHEVAHCDGDSSNNHCTNLRWSTVADNGADKATHGIFKGERNPRAKLTEATVRQIRSLYTGAYGEVAALARKFGLQHQCCSDILRGATWKHAR